MRHSQRQVHGIFVVLNGIMLAAGAPDGWGPIWHHLLWMTEAAWFLYATEPVEPKSPNPPNERG